MASPARVYQEEMHRNLGFFANWLPGDPIAIGDIGLISDGKFRRITSLKELAIAFDEIAVGSTQSVEYTSSGGTKIGMTAGASSAGFATAEIEINFSARGAFVFHATGMRARRLDKIGDVGRRLIELSDQSKWQKEWLLVEACHLASCATIIVSQDDSAKIILGVKSNEAALAISLANPKFDLAVTSSQGRLVHVIGKRDLIPLYSCMRVRRRLLGDAYLEPARGAIAQEPEFERPSLSELLDN